MSTFGSSGGQQSVALAGATNPSVTQVSMLTGGTEYSFPLPTGCKQFLIRTSGGAPFLFGYSTGLTLLSVPRYCFFSESGLTTTSTTIFFSSSASNETAEILTWT